MRNTILGILFIAILGFGSCQKGDSSPETGNLTDAELIEAIKNASDKQEVEINNLPSDAKTILDKYYGEDIIETAKLAPALGYEVDLREGSGPRVAAYFQAFFNIEGRELFGDESKYGDSGKDDGDESDWRDNKRKRCFELVLPVTFTMPDDTEITVEEKEDWILIRDWYKEHPDVRERPAVQYPVDIKWKDGTVKTINNEEEMKMARKKCEGDKGDRNRCFKMVLPVTYNMPDGSTITIEEREDWRLLREWYKDHPDYDAKPELQYPVDIKYKDGTVKTINSKEEMMEARKDCKGDGHKERCFHLVYPVSFTMPDGSTMTIEKKEDRKLLRQWYKDNPGYDEKPVLQYPVDIKYKDGTVLTINSREEMQEAKEACDDEDKG